MDNLNYKGFKGTVEYSETDDVFCGKIEGIVGLVNYEGENIIQLEEAFHEAVESYFNAVKLILSSYHLSANRSIVI